MNGKHLREKLVQVQNRLTTRIVVAGYLEAPSESLVRLGSPYGGWFIPENALSSADSRTLISLGVGKDVSFDKEVLSAGFSLVLVDPLAECIEFAYTELKAFKNYRLENVAISNFEGQELFYAPKNSQHDSWSSINIQSTSPGLAKAFPVMTLEKIISKSNFSIDTERLYLKMDIEGAEIKIIPDICHLPYKFSFIGIEFDFLSLIPFLNLLTRIKSVIQGRRYLNSMRRSGYKLVHIENFNFFWEPTRY